MKLLLVDNYDSFTWNVFNLIATTIGTPPVVIRNDEPNVPDLDTFDAVVISPGPGHPGRPEDFGICRDIVHRIDIPVLGICLGHQGMCHENGGVVSHAPRPAHGEVEAIFHNGESILSDIPSPFNAVRYHSLAVTEIPENYRSIAQTSDGVVMAVEATDRPHWGVQFHPESACSDFGPSIIRNFVTMARQARPSDNNDPTPQIHVRRVDCTVDPQIAFEQLFSDQDAALWLDSSAHSIENRFSFIADPSGPLFERLVYNVSGKSLSVHKNDEVENIVGIDLFDYLKAQVRERALPIPQNVPFQFNLGYAGYLGYEIKAITDGSAVHQSPHPDAQFFFVDRLLAYDHSRKEYWLLCLSTTDDEAKRAHKWLSDTSARLHQVVDVPAQPEATNAHQTHPAQFRHDKEAYCARIESSLEEIRNGESYEVCLTNMATAVCNSSGQDVYRRLRRVSPVPFGAYLKFDGLEVLCASPERFLSVSSDGILESKPIKGTRPVDPDPEKNRALIKDLASNTKDRAENLMIVDLVRNDLSRCCEVGSVTVAKLFSVESYSHVHQLVSTIRGKLRHESSVFDALRATFPGGSMTGAPKIRTMEIIDRLEEGARGVYSGSIGYLSLCGAADFNIVIRTIVVENNVATFGVGGAVIALSDVEDEYTETLVKARSSLAALSATMADQQSSKRAS